MFILLFDSFIFYYIPPLLQMTQYRKILMNNCKRYDCCLKTCMFALTDAAPIGASSKPRTGGRGRKLMVFSNTFCCLRVFCCCVLLLLLVMKLQNGLHWWLVLLWAVCLVGIFWFVVFIIIPTSYSLNFSVIFLFFLLFLSSCGLIRFPFVIWIICQSLSLLFPMHHFCCCVFFVFS